MSVVPPSTLVRGNVPTAAQWNAWGLGDIAFLAGITDDNDGGPGLIGSLEWPLPLLLSDANLAHKVQTGAGSYTVPPGVAYIITFLANGGGTLQITPSGLSQFTLSSFPSARYEYAHLPLGPGDTITTASGTKPGASGFTLSTRGKITPICRQVTNTSPFTVPDSKTLIVTHCSFNGALTGLSWHYLRVDGVMSLLATGMGADNTGSEITTPTTPVPYRTIRHAQPVQAGQILDADSSTPVTFAGYLVTQ